MFRSNAIKLFALTLLACAWFYSPGRWNQTARYDSIQALAEHGTFCIDAYLTDPEHYENTGDWARHDGRYYSNKAPGTMFLGALVYAPLYWTQRALLGHAPGPRLQAVNFWWINFCCSALPTALLAVLFCLILKNIGASERRALGWTLALVFTTPLWPYAGAMWGHNLAALFLTLSIYYISYYTSIHPSFTSAELFAPRTEPPAPETNHPSSLIPHSSFLVGLFAGLAVTTDYLAIAAIPCFAAFFLLRKRWKDLLGYAAGGLLPAAIYCFYHWRCFGNPFLPATFFNNPAFLDTAAAGGIVAGFKTNVLVQLLLGMPHGLFWCAPLCVFAIPGFQALWRRGGEHRALALLDTGWFLLSLALNATFNGWHGGSGVGPRYLLPAAPAWAFLAAAAPMRKPWQRWLAATIALLAAANMLVVASFTPLASELLFNPYTFYWKHFLAGTAPYHHALAYSLGRLVAPLWPWTDLAILLATALLFIRKCPGLIPTPHIQFAQIRSISLKFAQRNWPVLLALALLVALPSYVGLMGDEALLQALAFEANRALTWAKTGLVGSVGQAYGPLAIWFYQLLQMLTPNPIYMVLIKSLVVGGLSLAMLRYLAHRMRLPARIPALLFLLAPYCWHWTRCLWDNVFQLPLELASLTALVAYLQETDATAPRRRRQTLLLAAAVLAAILAVWLHTMALPFLATLPVFLLAVRRDLLRRDLRRILAVAIAGTALLTIILVPRLAQTRQAFAAQDTFNRTAKVTVWQGIKNAASFPALLSAATFEDTQMTAPIPDFTPLWKPLWRTIGYAMLAVTIALLAAGLVATWRQRAEPVGQIGLFAIINIVLQALFVIVTRLHFFPHYHQPVLISELLLAALGAAALLPHRPGRLAWRAWCALGTAAILVFLSHLALTGGQDRTPYGMTLAQQWPAIRTVARHVHAGQHLDVVAKTWQYSSLPVCLNILARLAAADTAGRIPPADEPPASWVLLNPVPGCGFLRIADVTDHAAPRDVLIEP